MFTPPYPSAVAKPAFFMVGLVSVCLSDGSVAQSNGQIEPVIKTWPCLGMYGLRPNDLHPKPAPKCIKPQSSGKDEPAHALKFLSYVFKFPGSSPTNPGADIELKPSESKALFELSAQYQTWCHRQFMSLNDYIMDVSMGISLISLPTLLYGIQ